MNSYTLVDSIKLAKKKFFRAPQWEFKLGVKILLGLLILYFLVLFLLFGMGLFHFIEKKLPGTDPILVLNQGLVYYFGTDLLIRYFFQATPVTDVKPLLTQPIRKSTVVKGVLLRSIPTIFNALPLVVLLPFCIVFSINKGANISIWSWFAGIIFLSIGVNFLIFMINKSKKFLLFFAFFFGIGIGLEKLIKLPLLSFFGKGLDALYQEGYWLGIPLLFLLWSVHTAYQFLKRQLYLDKGLGMKRGKLLGENLNLFDRWEEMGVFIKNDIRLILRNIRPRQVVLAGGLFLFYGVLFFSQDQYKEIPAIHILSGLFITGGFMLTFGQYVPAWESEYYNFLMCQNIPYKKYIKSKLYLIQFSVVLSTLLSLPYLIYGIDIMLNILATALFNFGLGGMITLFSGAFNTTPLKLNVKAKAFENTQNFSFTQLLFVLPKLLLPLVVFYIPYYFYGYHAGIMGLVLTGLGGILFQNYLLNRIVKMYQFRKHQTLSAFNK